MQRLRKISKINTKRLVRHQSVIMLPAQHPMKNSW